MKISCALPPSPTAPDTAAAAEDLGYERLWLYDSPALYPDVWVTLARVAERTDRIGLGVAVLVPSLRHPMTNAAAIATLADLAPGRLAVAFGTGFTGRHVLGQRPLPWAEVEAYVVAVRQLLAGGEVEWEGHTIQMVHPDGFSPSRPIDVPILVSALGPKGRSIAERIADGVFSVGAPQSGFDWSAVLAFGTVLDDGEDPSSARVLAAAGPGAVVPYHAMWETGAVDGLPGGADWQARLDEFAASSRHLRVHAQHLTGLNDWDRQIATADSITGFTLTGNADDVRNRVESLAAGGATEIAYQPMGPDLVGELERFARVARE